jgi:hypothetical protein
MGIFGDQPKTRDYGNKVNELKSKIAQLEYGGMTASAARLKKELLKYEKNPVKEEKVKPLSPKQLKAHIFAATGKGA